MARRNAASLVMAFMGYPPLLNQFRVSNLYPFTGAKLKIA